MTPSCYLKDTSRPFAALSGQNLAVMFHQIHIDSVGLMKLSLIGMSNTGKSYWSKILENKGFKRYGCDDLLEAKLGDHLKAFGYSGIEDVAKWMGQPYDSQYVETSKLYLDAETETMHEVFAEVKEFDDGVDVVIDTTGSVVYTGDQILQSLSALTKVFYLETPASVQEEMRQRYLAEPKPVIWGDSFNRRDDESNLEALGRCYPELLAWRSKRYQELADVTVDYHALRAPGASIEAFF